MKVILSAVMEQEEDGVEGLITVERSGVEDLHSLAQVVGVFARASGFTYVSDVGFEKEDGSMSFGEF